MVYSNKKLEIFTLTLFIVVSVIYPIFSFFVFLLWMSDKNKIFGKFFLVFFLLVFSIVNSSKHFDSDLAWYYDHYIWILNNGLSNYFGQTITGVYAKNTEPLMYYLFRLVGLFLGENQKAFLIIFTLIPYFIIMLSVKKFYKIFNVNKEFWILGFILVLCIGFTFTLSVHLMRQFLAQALIFLSILYFFDKKYLIFLSLVLISFFIHNSSLYIVSIFFLVFLANELFKNNKTIGILLFSILGFMASYLLTDSLVNSSDNLKYKDDGSISLIVYLMDFLIFLINVLIFFFVRKDEEYYLFKEKYIYVFSFYIINFISLLGFIQSPLMYLRFGFYMEVVRVLMLCVLVKQISLKFKYNSVITFFVFCFCIIYLILRLQSSELVFDLNFIDIFFLKFTDL